MIWTALARSSFAWIKNFSIREAALIQRIFSQVKPFAPVAAIVMGVCSIPQALEAQSRARSPEAAPAGSSSKKFESFAELRGEILNAIGGAQSRIWLVTDFLSDGEIVSALYIAQYRKVQVQVLLGRGKANSYMSRLNYLKAQNIPVFLRPPQFLPGVPTALLADSSLMLVNGDLDFLARGRRSTLTMGGSEERARFEDAFTAATQLGLAAVPRPIPLVGKAQSGASGFRGKIYKPSFPQNNTEVGGYRYEQASPPRPAGVPAKLPKTTVWQERAREKEIEKQREAAQAQRHPPDESEAAHDERPATESAPNDHVPSF